MSVPATTPPDEAHEAARERAQMPAMFLAANGALNLLVALFVAGYVIREAATPAEELRDAWVARLEKGGDAASGALERARAVDPGRFKRQRVAGEAAAAAVLLAGGALGVAGGLRMYRARSYALAVAGSLASLLPCLTPTSCCGAGELIGLWCVWVLLLPGVRAGFR